MNSTFQKPFTQHIGREVYLESCQTSKMVLFAEIFQG